MSLSETLPPWLQSALRIAPARAPGHVEHHEGRRHPLLRSTTLEVRGPRPRQIPIGLARVRKAVALAHPRVAVKLVFRHQRASRFRAFPASRPVNPSSPLIVSKFAILARPSALPRFAGVLRRSGASLSVTSTKRKSHIVGRNEKSHANASSSRRRRLSRSQLSTGRNLSISIAR